MMNNASMLFETFAAASPRSTGTEWQVPRPGVGTSATPGARMPATLSRMSSGSVLPFSTTMHTPIVISEPTKIARTGV